MTRNILGGVSFVQKSRIFCSFSVADKNWPFLSKMHPNTFLKRCCQGIHFIVLEDLMIVFFFVFSSTRCQRSCSPSSPGDFSDLTKNSTSWWTFSKTRCFFIRMHSSLTLDHLTTIGRGKWESSLLKWGQLSWALKFLLKLLDTRDKFTGGLVAEDFHRSALSFNWVWFSLARKSLCTLSLG